MPNQVLTHAQSGPLRRLQVMESTSQDSRLMPPPPLPSLSTRLADSNSTMNLPATSSGLVQRPSFVPSPSASGYQRFVPQTPTKSSMSAAATSSRPFVLLTPQHKTQQPQRFLPSSARPSVATAVSTVGALVGAGAVSQAPSRSPSLAGSGGQRAPFVPGAAR